jgi:hypothetical protein
VVINGIIIGIKQQKNVDANEIYINFQLILIKIYRAKSKTSAIISNEDLFYSYYLFFN